MFLSYNILLLSLGQLLFGSVTPLLSEDTAVDIQVPVDCSMQVPLLRDISRLHSVSACLCVLVCILRLRRCVFLPLCLGRLRVVLCVGACEYSSVTAPMRGSFECDIRK